MNLLLQDIYDNLKKIQEQVDSKVAENSIHEASNKLLALQNWGGLSSEMIYEAKKLLGKRQTEEWDEAKKKGYSGNGLKHYLEGVLAEEIAVLEFAEKLNNMLIKVSEWLRTIIATLRDEQNMNRPIKQN